MVSPVTEFDNKGNPIPNNGEERVLIGGCFLHDVETFEKQGYAGTGFIPTYYINLNKNYELKHGMKVLVDMNGQEISGEIGDIRHTSGFVFGAMSDYTTIYI